MFWFSSTVLILIGLSNFSNGMVRVRRVAGGEPIKNGEIPYVVAIKHKNNITCGGVIISPTKILTTARCANVCSDSKDVAIEDCIKKITVIAGTTDLSKTEHIYNIKHVKLHEKFVLDSLANDLSVITLESKIKFSDNIKPVSLPSEDLAINTVATASGWGARSKKSQTGENLTSIEERIISNEECSKIFQSNQDKTPIDVNDFCAIAVVGADKAGLCIGDSGDPLIQNGKVIGISAWGIGCATGYPDVFVNIYKNLNFIKNEMK